MSTWSCRWLGAMARDRLAVLLILSACSAQGQLSSSTEDLPCGGKDVTPCCERLQDEVLNSCMEFEPFGFSGATCATWTETIKLLCPTVCGRCADMEKPLHDICMFQLRRSLTNAQQVLRYCDKAIADFLEKRCDPACNITKEECASPNATYCMMECGNYNTCNCRQFRGSLANPFCLGETIYKGTQVRRPGQFYSCAQVPAHCMHTDWSLPCGRYKYCEPNLCLIQGIECTPRHQCEAWGKCEPSKGMCFWEFQPKGYPCNDGVFYTLNDTCNEGFCTGIADYCIAYNVSCDPFNSCMKGGVCHPSSGRCTYDRVPDETACDDGRKFTVQDQCSNGLCVGRPRDLCEQFGIRCTAPNWCYDAGVCDPDSGNCSEPTVAVGYRPCNDRDPTTFNDSCIDGVCIGQLEGGVDAYQFQTMGEGECADRDGLRMPRYTGDVDDEKECEMMCRRDPQCAGFAYAFPLCSIYGTVRFRAPPGSAWSFQAGTNPPGVIIETAITGLKGQRKSICRRKSPQGDTIVYKSDIAVNVEDFFEFWKVAVFFAVVLGCFFAIPLTRWCCRILRCQQDELEVEAMKVAQNPVILEAELEPQHAIMEGAEFDEPPLSFEDENTLRQWADGDEPAAFPPQTDPDAPPPLEPTPSPPGMIETDARHQ